MQEGKGYLNGQDLINLNPEKVKITFNPTEKEILLKYLHANNNWGGLVSIKEFAKNFIRGNNKEEIQKPNPSQNPNINPNPIQGNFENKTKTIEPQTKGILKNSQILQNDQNIQWNQTMRGFNTQENFRMNPFNNNYINN